MKKYTTTEFSKIVNVPRKTLRLWKKDKLIPYSDGNKTFYTDEHIKIVFDNFGVPKYGKKEIYDEKWIDFSSVPNVRFQNKIDWEFCINNNIPIPFKYNDYEGVFKIVGKEGNMLKVSLNNTNYSITTQSLKICNIGNLLGNITSEYRYEIGEKIINDTFNITITDRYRNKRDKKKFYRYRCNNCNQSLTVEEYRITKAISICPVCSGNKLISGFNDLTITAPWIINYLPKDVDPKKFTFGSAKKFYMYCPDCGRKTDKKIAIKTLYRTHSIGCICGDGFSYPNKFMYDVLSQLQDQKKIKSFKKEWSPKWLENKRFDFKVYLISNKIIIIEMDGMLGHGNRTIEKDITPLDNLEVDNWKDEQAKNHGIPVIRIPALESRKDYLLENIKKNLSNIIDLNEINWDDAHTFSISNYTKKVCEFYSNHTNISISELANNFNISTSTALRYIKIGEEVGWCKYNYELLKKSRGANIKNKAKKRQVCCYDLDDNFIKKYSSIKDAAIATGVSTTAISNCCKGITNKSAGLKWVYADNSK